MENTIHSSNLDTNHFNILGGLSVQKQSDSDYVIALAGNPNVGKSTIFNALTGMKQHTGNWPGKTVENTQGYYKLNDQGYVLVDIPGSYSLMARSAEEEAARDFICFGNPDAVIVVCDATSLQRNLNLVLQIIETGKRTVVCVNLLDEASQRKIQLNLDLLEKRLGVPVVGTTARSNQGLDQLMNTLAGALTKSAPESVIEYPEYVQQSIAKLAPVIKPYTGNHLSAEWIAARLLDGDQSFYHSLTDFLGLDLKEQTAVKNTLKIIKNDFKKMGITQLKLEDAMAEVFVLKSIEIFQGVVKEPAIPSDQRDRKFDKIFTSKTTGFPIMFLMLLLVFWITISGANVPSSILAKALFGIENWLANVAIAIGAPTILIDMLIHGVFNVVAWVVSVMLPPMAIFFPMFTLLEDFGYLPRVAFNLDRLFKACDACGKQALTMCMGFGCNAVGVTGSKIIDSPRERLIAIITNNFVPCNGRFPILISIISIFLVGSSIGSLNTFLGALILVATILFGVGMTLLISKILSMTVLKGIPSSFTLELPPYRKPQVGKVIVRSIFDRTLKVLGRAVIAAAPAGLIIWILNNLQMGDTTLLHSITNLFDPFGKALGMDGAIIIGFILGLPANEIVMPIIIMIYSAQGGLIELEGAALGQLLIQNGWTWVTAISTLLFTLMHWPCATTLLTIRKETQSSKWTIISFLAPTLSGIIITFLFNSVVSLFV
ncbi:MAG TPA: ferrous iron transport protein B [Clostridiaceae bacterium]|nr:ferrous iron transport protein B [Clostridiaceae bacterium]